MDKLKKALYINISRPKSIKERLIETIASVEKLQIEAASFADPETGLEKFPSSQTTFNSPNKPLITGCGVCTDDIRNLYKNDEDPDKAEKVILVLKLCLAQLATGQATVDSEVHAAAVAQALGLGNLWVQLGPRQMMASFGGDCGRVILLGTRRNIILCKLADITHLAILMANKFTSDAKAANILLDEIMEAPLPFGWLVVDVFVWMFSTLAAVSAFYGSYYDLAIVAVISFVVILTQHVAAKFPVTLKPIESILVCIVVGICGSAAWRYIMDPLLGEDRCHVRVIFLSSLLMYLPGSELVYAAYEIKMGQVVVGSSRLVGATVRCMFIASGLTIGWQAFGHAIMNDEATKRAASLIPWKECDSSDIDSHDVGPWWLVWGVHRLIFLFPCLGIFSVHPVNYLGTYLVAYPSMLLYGFLNFGCDEEDCELPDYLIKTIVYFFGTSLSCIREYLTGIPAVSALIPVILMLGPGASTVSSMLHLMSQNHGVNVVQKTSDIFISLAFEGVSYALGMFLAFALWAPLLNKQRAKTETKPKFTIAMARRAVTMDRW